MAEMYKENIASGYKYSETAVQITGERLFHRDDSGGSVAAADLPAPGGTAAKDLFKDPSGSTVSGCYCREKVFVFLGGGSAAYGWLFKYSTRDSSMQGDSGGGESVSTDSDTRRFDVGGEMVSLSTPGSDWLWKSDDAAVDQPVYRRVVNGRFTIPKPDMSESAKNTFLGLVKAQAGTINAASFEGFNIGEVLFAGISGGTYYDEEGNLRWSFDMQFEFRCIPGITNNDWQYILRDNGEWDRPYWDNSGADVFLYSTSDFSALTT